MDSLDLRPAETPGVLTVARLVSSARLVLERHLGVVWVRGEISNLYRAASGHLYFTLKDASAQVKCAMFRSKAQLAGFALRDGLAVEVRALPSIYDGRGEFQLNVDAIRHAGFGELYERFQRLKAKLAAAGWLAPERKRPLPAFPRAVGVVTSPRGAAIADVLTTLKRRWPALRVVVYPAAVQGEAAAADIVRAIGVANARAEVEVLIVCRGGGSIEDLWPFNEPIVARAVHASGLPIVSAIGHETDFTICDFVADVRAPTPTAAATLVAPDRAEHCRRAEAVAGRLARAFAHARSGGEQRTEAAARRLGRATAHVLAVRAQRTDAIARRLVHPAARLAAQRQRLDELRLRLARCWSRQSAQRSAAVAGSQSRLLRELRTPPAAALALNAARTALLQAGATRMDAASHRIARLAQSLAHLNPSAVLARGYAIVVKADGEVVLDRAQVSAGDDVTLTLARGEAKARIR